MARKGRGSGWFGERRRHRLAAMRGTSFQEKAVARQARRAEKLASGEFKGPMPLITWEQEKRIVALTEILETRIWDRMGEYGFRPDDYRNIKEFERVFDEWRGWEDAYSEIGGEVAHEFDLKPSTQDDLAIEIITDIVHNRIHKSIMDSMAEMIKYGPEGRRGLSPNIPWDGPSGLMQILRDRGKKGVTVTKQAGLSWKFVVNPDLTVDVVNPDGTMSHHSSMALAQGQRGFTKKDFLKAL